MDWWTLDWWRYVATAASVVPRLTSLVTRSRLTYPDTRDEIRKSSSNVCERNALYDIVDRFKKRGLTHSWALYAEFAWGVSLCLSPRVRWSLPF